MPIRLVIADDHAIFRTGLRMLLEKEHDFVVVAEAANGPDTVMTVAAADPEVVILDLSMPGLPGAKVAEQLLAAQPSRAIVILTMHEDEHYLRELFRIGARAFVLKKSTATDLAQAVRAAARGERYVDPSLAAALLAAPARGRAGAATAAAPSRADLLTPREQEVCALLARGHTNAEIAGRLHISERTVESHRANLMGKAGLKTRADLVRFAIECGLTDLRSDK
ncbi:MAG: response regulator transcription factor [Planctomycetes bacterium]|nr:response regulator transcription factor [Planctomycetota bacterium]